MFEFLSISPPRHLINFSLIFMIIAYKWWFGHQSGYLNVKFTMDTNGSKCMNHCVYTCNDGTVQSLCEVSILIPATHLHRCCWFVTNDIYLQLINKCLLEHEVQRVCWFRLLTYGKHRTICTFVLPWVRAESEMKTKFVQKKILKKINKIRK